MGVIHCDADHLLQMEQRWKMVSIPSLLSMDYLNHSGGMPPALPDIFSCCRWWYDYLILLKKFLMEDLPFLIKVCISFLFCTFLKSLSLFLSLCVTSEVFYLLREIHIPFFWGSSWNATISKMILQHHKQWQYLWRGQPSLWVFEYVSLLSLWNNKSVWIFPCLLIQMLPPSDLTFSLPPLSVSQSPGQISALLCILGSMVIQHWSCQLSLGLDSYEYKEKRKKRLCSFCATVG